MSLASGKRRKERKKEKRNPTNDSNSSAVIPALAVSSIIAYNLWEEHWEHWSHMPPLEERTEYPYQNIRVKNYNWGDGDKVCFLFLFFVSIFLRAVLIV